MAEVKLTDAQAHALAQLPLRYSTWGGKPFSGIPGGVREQTLFALHRRNLASILCAGLDRSWSITPAGLSLLQSMKGE